MALFTARCDRGGIARGADHEGQGVIGEPCLARREYTAARSLVASEVCLTSPTTPTTVYQGRSVGPTWRRLPMGSWCGNWLRASDSLIQRGWGAEAVSRSSRKRPLRSGMPMVWQNCGLIA